MKKIIAMSMSLVLTAGIFTGCSREPGEKDTLRRLEDVCGGENIEIVYDGRARSLDRDLEFTYRYDWEGTPIWPDININMGGKYHLDTEYYNAVHNYWNDEYRRCIEKYNFADVDYGEDGDDEDKCCPSQVYIFIEEGASEEDLKKVDSLLLDLREICREEDEFHSWDYYNEFSYLVYVWYIDSDAGVYQEANIIVIEKDTEDQRLQLDNLRIAHTDSDDPRDEEYGFGRAKIYVN